MNTDRRINKTKKAIQKSFLNILENKNITEVTVADIVKDADIARSTFYLHYADVYDLYEQIVIELMDELIDRFDKLYPKGPAASNFMQLINYIVEQKELFYLLVKKNSENKLIDNLTDIFTNRVLTIEKIDKNNKKEYYEVLFTVTGAISLFINWLMKDREMKPSELSNILNDIILKLD